MSSNSTEHLVEFQRLWEILKNLQNLEFLYLSSDNLQDADVNVAERARRLNLLRGHLMYFNDERLRILVQLRQNLAQRAAMELNSTMSLRQEMFDLSNGLYELSDRMSSTSDDHNCPICLSPWTSQGSHRVVSLRCGHLFGSHCIKTAIRRSRRCPICRRRARLSDVRRIYGRCYSM
ncbi:putative RING-H2 finger protein ATL21A [Drosophila eugracilis]|uniref:putative RING-H2 finger protein ATL21A n=1 Tax=Drosophila eugracilis TaxID=29029 RepID=UPI0007E86601|nr:putative RING-H2 finger protein ATL21A [Drosophila eugracilis]